MGVGHLDGAGHRTAEAYVWGYLEAYAAALATLIGVADEVGDHATLHLRTFVVPHYHGWVRLLLAALSHPANIDLTEMGTSSASRMHAAALLHCSQGVD